MIIEIFPNYDLASPIFGEFDFEFIFDFDFDFEL